MDCINRLCLAQSCFIQFLDFRVLRFVKLMMPVDDRQQDMQQPISEFYSETTLKALFGPQPPGIDNAGYIFDLPPELASRVLVVWYQIALELSVQNAGPVLSSEFLPVGKSGACSLPLKKHAPLPRLNVVLADNAWLPASITCNCS